MKTLNQITAGMMLFLSTAALAQTNDSTTVRSTTVTTEKTSVTPTPTPVVVTPTPVIITPAPEPVPVKDKPYFRGLIGASYMPTFSTFDIRNSQGNVVQSDVVMSNGFSGALGFTGKHVGLQLEVIYNELSQKYRDNNVDRRVDINYVNVPLLLVLNTDKSRIFNVNVAAGPQLGINVGSNVTTTSNGNGTDTYQGVVAVKKGDFGFAYGAGIEVALDPKRCLRLGLGFRGVVGLVDVSDKSYTRTTNQYMIIDRTHIETYSGYAGLSFLF
ncbi:MAG: porin family protein [Bacteroidia bacterium]